MFRYSLRSVSSGFVFVFFFQAEDGIRDIGVTGVQTCALPIWHQYDAQLGAHPDQPEAARGTEDQRQRSPAPLDRKSTRLNSSHANISYAVFCLKKKKIGCSMTAEHHQINLLRVSATHDLSLTI